MNKLTEFLTKPFIEEDVLAEGARDPGIFKAIFLAGGPGSGKTYVASKLFGIPERVNVSRTGLKMVNQDTELEYLMNKYFQTTDLDNIPDELFIDLTGVDRNGNPVDYGTSGLRSFAKSLSKERLRIYTEGRLGVIIDGTGHKFKSVKDQKRKLENLGYDSYMVFVNTSLEVALERNEQRTRVVPEPIVRQSWQEVQNNLAFLQGLFGGSNFLIVDNNKYLDADEAKRKFKMLVNMGITKFLNKPVSSKIGKAWIAKEKKFHKVFKDPGQSRFFESIDVPVEIGDTVKMGRFKNKKVVVKSIDWNEKGDLLINNRPALKFRLVKKANAFDEEFGAPVGMLPSPSRKGINKNKTKNKVMGNIDECITFANKFGNDVVLGKNRDRNYSPNLLVVRELTGYGTEICYVMDKDTDWCEGINSHGIGIVNTALFVKRDEKEFDKTKKIKAPSKDGARVREALGYKKISDVVRSLVTFHDGIKGHTIVSDGKKVAVIENTSRVKPYVTIHDLNQPLVRTNHGIKHPEQGYTRGPDRVSSQTRMKYAQELVKTEKNYKEVFPKFYNHTQKLGPKYDMVRSQNQLWTSSQLLINLNKLNMILYLIPGKVHFKGIINKLPKGYKSKIGLEVRQYEHSPDDKYDTFVTTDKVKKPDILAKKINIKENLDLYMQKVVYSIVESGDSASNLKEVNEKLSRKDQIKQNKLRDERQKLIKKAIGFGSGANSHKLKLQIKDIEKQIDKLNEAKQIKKVIGVFGGRFQPFHSGHLATYKWLKGKVDEAYITTSNIKQPPRHPMNFSEKVRHMTKMGVPKNRIIQETSPYVAKNLLRKYDPETTAVVYVVGGKDAGRLGGKYFKPYTKDMKGFDVHGYILTAPQAGSISGTKARELLGDPKIDDSERQKRFKNTFGYFDKGVFQMMRNKFKKLFESYTLTDELIEEFLLEATGTPGGNLDDGPSTYYTDLKDYKESTKNWIDNLYSGAGWKIIDYIVSNNAIDPMENISKSTSEHTRRKPGKQHYVSVDVTHLDAGQEKGSASAVGEYKKWMTDVVKPLGWEIVNWMGTDAAINNIIGDLMVGGADGFSYEVKDKDNFHEQINSKSVLTQKNKGKELLLMGGAYGHLNHPFDNNNLTFSDFRTLIINTLQGNLSNDGTVTEKTDGQNIMISWKNGKLIAARNGGHIKNFGAAALSISGVKSMFAGRGDLEKAFVGAMVDLSNAIGRLSNKQKDKIFAEGKKFMSLEIIYPKTANVIPYDKSLLQFHGTIEYNAAGAPIGSDSSSARILAGMIKQINQSVQKTFSVTGPFVANLPKVKNFSQRQSYFLGKLNTLQDNYGLRSTDTLADYHQKYWMEYILNGANQTDFPNITNDILVKLTKRWAFFDKSYKIPQIKKDLKEDHPKFLEWVLATDKYDHARLQKQHIRDWEVLFFELGAEILKNLSEFIAANPDEAVQKIKKDISSAISKVKNSKDPKVLNTLKTQLDRLNAIGGLDAVVPTEGITFMFRGKLYKYTGAFAPANQILGMLKYV